MPIRSLLRSAITEATLRDMIARGIREDRTLDFKQDLSLGDSGKLDILQDVTAMANASGGAILYGAIEGEGDERARIIDLRGLHFSPDQLDLTIANLLRDNVDERLPGVEHFAIPLEGGSYCYLIRVASSHLAPHMITLPSKRARFYVRGTVSNDPMNARQIREGVMRTETGYDRARERVAERIAIIDRRARARQEQVQTQHNRTVGLDFIALHLLPVFPPPGGYDLADRSTQRLVQQNPPFGRIGDFDAGLSFDGMWSGWNRTGDGINEWLMLLRSGGLEVVSIDNAISYRPGQHRTLLGPEKEGELLLAVDQARAFFDAGLLGFPLMLSLQLRNISGIVLQANPLAYATRLSPVDSAPIEPVIVNRWEETSSAMRRLFDVMWQTWGYARSPSYDENGDRRDTGHD